MNLHAELRTTLAQLPKALKALEPEITRTEHDGAETLAVPPLAALKPLITGLGFGPKDELLITISEHRTTQGDGFRPCHLSVTISAVDPAAS